MRRAQREGIRKQWRLTAEIILIAAVCMAGMWQNTKKTIESISDVKKKEEEKRIAITFDDGPDGISTPVLLDGLKERESEQAFCDRSGGGGTSGSDPEDAKKDT